MQVAQWVVIPSVILSGLLVLGLSGSQMFHVGFTIENRTDRPVTVTPVGTWFDRGGVKGPLPTLCEWGPFPAVRNGKYVLAPGERVTVYYDSDDVVVSEIVVETGGQPVRNLPVDPTQKGTPGSPLVEPVFVIDSVDKLPAAPANVQVAAARTGSRAGIVTVLAAGIVLPWLVGGFLVVVEWRLKRSLDPEPQRV